MKIIKCARVFKATLPSASALETHLEEHPFIDPMPSAAGAIGFVPRIEGGTLVDSFEGGVAFTVRIDDKIVPSSAVNAEVNKRCKAVKEETGRKPGKAHRADIKDEVLIDFRIKALVKSTIVSCLYDIKRGYLIVPVTNAGMSDRIVTLLIQAVGTVKTETIHVSDIKHGLTTRMQAWLDDAEDNAFDDFMPTGQVALTLDSQRLSIKMSTLENARAALQKAIKDGFTVKDMRLTDADFLSFVLTHDFQFKSITSVDNGDEPQDIEDWWLYAASVELLMFANTVEKLAIMFAYKETTEAA